MGKRNVKFRRSGTLSVSQSPVSHLPLRGSQSCQWGLPLNRQMADKSTVKQPKIYLTFYQLSKNDKTVNRER